MACCCIAGHRYNKVCFLAELIALYSLWYFENIYIKARLILFVLICQKIYTINILTLVYEPYTDIYWHELAVLRNQESYFCYTL